AALGPGYSSGGSEAAGVARPSRRPRVSLAYHTSTSAPHISTGAMFCWQRSQESSMDAHGANTGVFQPPPSLTPASIGCGDCGSKAWLGIAAQTDTNTVEVHQAVNRHCWGYSKGSRPR